MVSEKKRKNLILATMAIASLVAFGCGSDDSEDGDCYGKVCGSNQICDDTAKACVDKAEPESCTGLMGPDYRVCSDECTNIYTDPKNCGGCGNPCAEGLVCNNGVCGAPSTCTADQKECNGTCKDIKTDPQNCGECGATCGANQVCQGGICQDTVTCDKDKSQCGNQCYDLTNDDNHCGSCSNACHGGQKCSNGKCIDVCDDSEKCDGVCVNKMADDNNCGECGHQCSANETCQEGKCEAKLVCQGTLEACGTKCVDLTNDNNNCGSCDRICPTGETCVDSDCTGGNDDDCDDMEAATCDGNAIKECKDKKYVLTKCGDDQICNDGECIDHIVEDECNEEEFVPYCEGNSIKTCQNKQFNLQDCGTQVCDGAKCVDDVEVVKCDENFVPRCDDNNAVACTNGIETPTSCGTLFCYQGECRDDIDCDSENFTPQCDGDTAIMTCTDNIKGKTDCGTNQLCISGECKTLPDDLCPFDNDKKAPGVCGCGIPDADLDGNGIIDCVESGVDLCPDDNDKTTPGICGCNIPDTMVNGIPKCLSGAENFEDVDLCPGDPNKNLPGVCGCGLSDAIDTLTRLPQCIVKNKLKEQISLCGDNAKTEKYLPGTCGCDVEDEIDPSTGVPKCLAENFDLCPDDDKKTEPGICGCGKVDDTKDTDGDGTPDCLDQCPNSKFKTIVDSCGCDKLSYNLDGNTICALPIETAEEFLDFKDKINGNTLANTTGLAAVLLNDITINTSEKWVGFKDYLGKFVSTGKTISGTLDCQNANNCALFTGLNGGRIHNVNLDLDVKGGNNSALLVATASGATVSKVNAKGSVNGGNNIGGIVATANGATLLDVTADVAVTGTSNNVGGVVANATTATLTNVSHSGKVASQGYYIGGVVGYVKDSKLTNLSHTGDIDASNEQIGGIAGRITGTTTATQLNANANINALGNRYYIGGVVGLMDGDAAISKASSAGSITSQCSQTGGIAGRMNGNAKLNDASSSAVITNTTNNTGGIVGYLTGTSAIDKAEFTGSVNGQSNTAGIAGYLDGPETTIANADVDAEIIGTSYTGGILGSSNSNINKMSVQDVTVAGSVKGTTYVGGVAGSARLDLSGATNDATVDGVRVVGGIVGEFGSGKLSNVTNNGAVTAANESGNTNAFVGGIIGNLLGGKDHTGLTNTGAVSATSTKSAAYGSYTGGVIGNITNTEHGTTLTTVKNSGAVTSIGEYVGGVVGFANTTAFKDVENSGDVTGGTNVSSGGVGGVIGQLSLSGLPADKGIDYKLEDLKNSGAISGANRVGGVVGHLWSSSTGAEVTLKNIESSGNVTGTKDSIGGIVGRLIHNGNATLLNTYNTGNVTSSTNYVGGLIGSLPANNDSSFYSTGARTVSTTIDHSFAGGTIKGNLYIGGLVGYINTDFLNHNYDKDISVTCYNDSTVTKTYNRWHYFDATNLIVIRNSYSAGVVDANNQAGGLVGFVEGTSSEKTYTNNVYKFVYDSETEDPCKWIASNTEADGAVDKVNGIGKVIIANTYSSSQVKGVNKEFGGLVGKVNYTNKLAASNNYLLHNVYTTGIVDESGAGVISAKPSAADFSKVYAWASSGPATHTLGGDVEEIVNFEYSSKVAKIDDKTLVDILNTNVSESETDDLKSDNAEKWIEKDANLDLGTKVKLAGFNFPAT